MVAWICTRKKWDKREALHSPNGAKKQKRSEIVEPGRGIYILEFIDTQDINLQTPSNQPPTHSHKRSSEWMTNNLEKGQNEADEHILHFRFVMPKWMQIVYFCFVWPFAF